MADAYITKIKRVEAIQLVKNGREDNAGDVARFCGGDASWKYSSETGETHVVISGPYNDMKDRNEAYIGDWMIKREDGMFEILSNDLFHARYSRLVTEHKEICTICLSDPRFTPQGDPEDVTCDECGVRYTGYPRSQEFELLRDAGIAEVIGK